MGLTWQESENTQFAESQDHLSPYREEEMRREVLQVTSTFSNTMSVKPLPSTPVTNQVGDP